MTFWYNYELWGDLMSTINVLITSDCADYGKAIKSMLRKAQNTYRVLDVLSTGKVL